MAEIDTAIDNAAGWLLALQRHDSHGWPGYAGSKGTSVMNTAEALIGLSGVGVEPSDYHLRTGAKYLVEHQIDSGPDAGAWGHGIIRDDRVERR